MRESKQNPKHLKVYFMLHAHICGFIFRVVGVHVSAAVISARE